MWKVNESRFGRKCRRLPVFTAGRRRTRVAYCFEAGRFIWIENQFTALKIHPKTCVGVRESLGRENLPVGAIDNIQSAISVWVRQHLSRLPVDVQVEENVFIHPVVIVQ